MPTTELLEYTRLGYSFYDVATLLVQSGMSGSPVAVRAGVSLLDR